MRYISHDCLFLDNLSLKGEISWGSSDRNTHAGDFGTRAEEEVQPDAVVFAESTSDVSTVVAAANTHEVPVTPYAAGTGLEANATPVEGALVLTLHGWIWFLRSVQMISKSMLRQG